MVWFGLVLIYDKLVQSGSKFSIKGLVSPFLKRFGLDTRTERLPIVSSINILMLYFLYSNLLAQRS